MKKHAMVQAILLAGGTSLCTLQAQATNVNEGNNGAGAASAGAAPAGAAPAAADERAFFGRDRRLTLEPAFSYSHNSSVTVAVEGFTIVPAVLVGLINVQQAQRDSLNLALSARYALTDRLQVGVRVPFLYTQEEILERQAFKDSEVDILRASDGEGLGDVEATLQYQLNTLSAPYFTGSLRLKSHTGTDPFNIARREIRDSEGISRGFVFVEQPTGSGFWAVQPSLGLVAPSDPGVIYGSLSYLWNVERDLGPANGGSIDPGDVIGMNFGIGFAINDRSSFNLGYDHSVILKSKTEADRSRLAATFDRFQVGSFLLGVSHALSGNKSLNVSLGIGVTEQAPDVQITIKTPIRI